MVQHRQRLEAAWRLAERTLGLGRADVAQRLSALSGAARAGLFGSPNEPHSSPNRLTLR